MHSNEFFPNGPCLAVHIPGDTKEFLGTDFSEPSNLLELANILERTKSVEPTVDQKEHRTRKNTAKAVESMSLTHSSLIDSTAFAAILCTSHTTLRPVRTCFSSHLAETTTPRCPSECRSSIQSTWRPNVRSVLLYRLPKTTGSPERSLEPTVRLHPVP